MLLKPPRYRRADYVDILKLLYDILVKIRKSGMLAIEADLEAPEKSKLFTEYPRILADHHFIEFTTDCLRLMVGGNLDPHELESLLEYELENHHKESAEPAHAVQRVADALPGFGIVAAVLGIVNTMGAIEGADTATIGHKVAIGAGRHLPRHPGGLRLRRPDRAAMEHRVTRRARPSRSSRWPWSPACAATRRRSRSSSRASSCLRKCGRNSPTSRSHLKGKKKEGGRGVSDKVERPIVIVKRRKSGHGGHHGGAWKVAYADFVTAMMAFFLVMWLVTSVNKEQRAAIFEYFKNPSMEAGQSSKAAKGPNGPGRRQHQRSSTSAAAWMRQAPR
jgi:hypothetical protein